MLFFLLGRSKRTWYITRTPRGRIQQMQSCHLKKICAKEHWKTKYSQRYLHTFSFRLNLGPLWFHFLCKRHNSFVFMYVYEGVPMEAKKGLLVCCSITPYLSPLEQGLSLTPEVYWWPWSLTSCWGYSFRAVSVGSRNSCLQVVTLMLTLSIPAASWDEFLEECDFRLSTQHSEYFKDEIKWAEACYTLHQLNLLKFMCHYSQRITARWGANLP